MSWGFVAGATVSLVGGSVLGGKSSRASARAGDASAQASLSSAEYYDALRDISEQEFTVWKKEGLPILRELAGMRESEDLAMDRAASDTRTQYALGRERAQRALGFARNPGDPGYADIMANTYLDEASAVSRAVEDARLRTRETNFGRGAAVLNAYRGIGNDAMSALSRAGAGQNAVAAGLSREASRHDANAAQAGYGFSNLAMRGANRWLNPISPTGGGTPPGTPGGLDPGFDPNFYGDAGGGDFTGNYMDFADGGAIRRGRYADGGEVEGGKIKGPGTGTSDSISAIKRPGTYILSADTVRALGDKKLEDLMEKAGVRKSFGGGGEESDKTGVPVRTSNGEWAMPPEVTKYYGEEFFNKLQQKYHRPVQNSDDGMANGGAIRRRQLPRRVEDAILSSVPARAMRR